MNHYYLKENQPIGPFHLSEMMDLIKIGIVNPEVLVAREGDSQWSSLHEIDELAPIAATSVHLKNAELIQAEKIMAAAQPKTDGEMVGFIILALLVPLIGFIIGLVWCGQPRAKHDQGITLIIVSVIASVIYFGLITSIR
jgi:hypothetical protein